MQLRPARAVPLLQQVGQDLPRHQNVALSGRDIDIPHRFPLDARTHKAAQKIPVGQCVLLIVHGPHGSRRAVLRGQIVLRQILRHVAGHAALRPVAAAEKHQRHMGQQLLHHGLLTGREKRRVAEDLPLRPVVQLIVESGQQQPVLLRFRRRGDAALFVHTVLLPCFLLPLL